LETLILTLLAKAPSDRPESACEVLGLLETIDPSASDAENPEGNPLERLAKGVFVGREREIVDRQRKWDTFGPEIKRDYP
jgi:hypothetical protein